MQPEPQTQTLTFGSIANYTCIAQLTYTRFSIMGWLINIEGDPTDYTEMNVPPKSSKVFLMTG